MSVAVAVFVKTPGLSPLKTRLAADIGEERALEFYQLSVKAIEETLGQAGEVTPYWAVAEDDGLDNPLWAGFKTLQTGEGDLGARQGHVYETLRRDYKKVILIGADAPQLSPEIFKQAIAVLDENDFVFGPACDGGYYLFGGCLPVGKNIWAQVPWSAENTREVFEGFIISKPAHLEFLTDVDMAGDLQMVVEEMPESVSAAQQDLIDWVNRC